MSQILAPLAVLFASFFAVMSYLAALERKRLWKEVQKTISVRAEFQRRLDAQSKKLEKQKIPGASCPL